MPIPQESIFQMDGQDAHPTRVYFSDGRAGCPSHKSQLFRWTNRMPIPQESIVQMDKQDAHPTRVNCSDGQT
ncbi:hypothetical protein, partial [Microseira sp. BLCC-F43]|uniref:hypothetical protein n=1 Tax=Microseira sp. BLCC-F43 TaxID=3153602 RepID=UPI0035B9523F